VDKGLPPDCADFVYVCMEGKEGNATMSEYFHMLEVRVFVFASIPFWQGCAATLFLSKDFHGNLSKSPGEWRHLKCLLMRMGSLCAWSQVRDMVSGQHVIPNRLLVFCTKHK